MLEIAPGLAESLADGDLVYATFLDTVDEYVKRRGMELPEDPDARATFANPPCVTAPLTRLDLAAEGISAVIWATGYGVDFGWIDLPVTDAEGERGPPQRHHPTVPGLYFLGLQWLSKMNSSFLSGVGDDAAVLADHILGRPGEGVVYDGGSGTASAIRGAQPPHAGPCSAPRRRECALRSIRANAIRKNQRTCEPVHIRLPQPCSLSAMGQSWGHAMIYGGFEIQSFEAGRGLWHARIQRADQEPVVIDGMAFPTLEVGFAWSDPEAAIADAKAHIDRFKPRFANP